MRSSGAPRAVSSRTGRLLASTRRSDFGQLQAAFARHHHVEHHQVGIDEAQLLARLGGVAGGGDAKAVLGQIARQQAAQPIVVVDHQDMRIVLRRWLHRTGLSLTRPPVMLGRLRLIDIGARRLVHDTAHHAAEALHRRPAGLAVGGGQALALALEQPALQRLAAFGVSVSSRWRRSSRPGAWAT